jgi:hypothetical protein
MKRTIYDYNNLLRIYNKYRRKFINLHQANKNHRRQHILQKNIAKLHEKLSVLSTTLRLSKAAASVVVGSFAFVQSANAQIGFAPKQVNPFNIASVGYQSNSTPTFADIDGDGDLDMLTGDYDYYYDFDSGSFTYENRFKYYENIGTAANPIFAAPVINPFGITGNNNYFETFAPTFVDIDGDGDMDIVYGDSYGNFNYLENTGTPSAPAFAAPVSNPFNIIPISGGFYNGRTIPSFVDIDGDGDLDLVAGALPGDFYYFENIGSASNPNFAAPITNAFNLSRISYFGRSAPTFIDIDGDGDFDLLSGNSDGNFYYFENIGTSSVPDFATYQMNPFNLTYAGNYSYSGNSTPTFADLDNDGDLDLISGDGYGDFTYFRQCAASTSTLNISTACSYTTPDGMFYNSSGTFTRIIENADGCDSIITINLTINPLAEQTVTPLNSVLCGPGATTIDLGSTQDGVSYYLRDNADNSVIAGPLVGDGSGISFNTGTISSDVTYNVYAEKLVPTTGLQFAGNDVDDKRINCGNNPNVQISGSEITLETWIYPTEWKWAQWGGNIINKEGAGDLGYMLRCGDNGRVNFNLGNGSWNELSSPQNSLSLNTWHHVAATYDGSTMSIYVDGNLVASQNSSITFSSPNNNLTIGNWANGTGRAFIGKIDEVRIWSVAKTENEIQADLNACLSGNESGLEAYYQFEDGTASTVLSDLTSNGNDGTLINMDQNNDWVSGASVCSTCNLDLTQTATVTIVPELVGTNNTTICNNESIVINGTTYDATNSTGIEIFTNVGVNGCDSTVTVSLNVLPALVGTNNTTICNNESIVINGTTYDATNSTGTEVFSNVGVNGCDSTVTVTLNVLPALNTTTSVTNETITATLSGASYQWVDCDNGNASIAGATSQSFTATTNGNYAVEITDNGCTETSSCVSVLSVGVIENSALSVISIFPNPSTGMFTVSTNQLGKNYIITDNIGKVVMQGILNTTQMDIDISNNAKGIYLLTIEGHVFKLVKQ